MPTIAPTQGNNSASLKITKIPVNEIAVPKDRFILDQNSSPTLKELIALIGLRTPISVRARVDGHYDLVTGRQRLKAVTELGNDDTIDCFVYDQATPNRDIQLWEVSENLHRSTLTKDEKKDLIIQYAALQHGTTKPATGEQVSTKGGRGKKGGDAQIARDLGVSRATVRDALHGVVTGPKKTKAAKEEAPLSHAVISSAHNLDLAEDQQALDAVAALKTDDARIAELHAIAKAKEPVVVTPPVTAPSPPRLSLAEVRHLWDTASDEERYDFQITCIKPWRDAQAIASAPVTIASVTRLLVALLGDWDNAWGNASEGEKDALYDAVSELWVRVKGH